MALPLLFRGRQIRSKLGLLRYTIVASLLLMMIGVPVKILLRLLFDVKYIVETPWFNI